MKITIPDTILELFNRRKETIAVYGVVILLSVISVWQFIVYFENKLGLAYNDARSHLDIGRRVVEGLKPGLAQIGSVWLPLNHVLMVPTIWHDFMWHAGLAGALQSMVSFVGTGILIFLVLKELKVGILGRLLGVAIFTANINILYLQSTAMTELLLIVTMTAGVYELIRWHASDNILDLIKAAFWIMLATLTRYDGWFLLGYAAFLVVVQTSRKRNFSRVEGTIILFLTLAAIGVIMWFLWNLLIFKDPLYFAFGPFSAHAQQQQLDQAGVLITKHDLWLSIQIYFYALFYNTYTWPAIIALIGAVKLFFDKTLTSEIRTATTALLSPLWFNILALYLGFSVLFIQGISGNTWFNVRYGIMLMPTIAILIGYLIDRSKTYRSLIVGLLIFVLLFGLVNSDAVTIDDARVGSSHKNVSEVSGYLARHAAREKGFILISAASHDAIIFSSGLPMKRFIHEGTGAYWESATTGPEHWARWIVMRTYDNADLTWKLVSKTSGLSLYRKVASYPFADIYELTASQSGLLKTDPILGKQK